MGLIRRAMLPAGILVTLVFGVIGFFAIAANAVEPAVSETPRTEVMQVVDGQVLDSVVIGNRVIVVGSFTQVRNPGGNTINQPYLAAYNATTGRFDPTYRPQIDGTVRAIATDGIAAYIVGRFDTVDGEAHRRIAKIRRTGVVNPSFNASIEATPNTVAVANGKVYIGGPFRNVNGQPREHFAAVNKANGRLDSFTSFDFSESAQAGGGTTVRWIEASPDGSFLFMSHSARRIDGQVRTGIAKFDTSATSTTLSNWQTLLYENEVDRFSGALRLRRLAISPDGSYVVQTSSGDDRPPAGDTAVRFPTNGGANTQADWVSRHFDTVLGVAIGNDAVYVGGHFFFQEAPGSTNPFPGDPNTNFGLGGGQGPQVLGSEVVAREQLGALDPATGKSLDWNPGSNSFIGPQSLTFDSRLGLLVGHDGTRLGGVNGIGRHAVFPIGGAPTAPPPPTTGDNAGGGNAGAGNTGGAGGGNASLACAVSFNGNNATLTFTGDTGNDLQARRNGTWAATVTGNTATINANPGDTIVGRVRGPNYDGPTDITCTTGGNAGAGNTGAANTGGGTAAGAITTTIDSPVNGAVLNAGNVTLSGQATAADGIRRVRITVVEASTGRFLTPNGTFVSEFTSLEDDLFTTATSAPWSINVNIGRVGTYRVTARTIDSNGERNATIRSSFVIGGAADAPPSIDLASPDFDQSFPGSTMTVNGTISDDLGVDRVTFLILNPTTGEFLRRDGSIGAAQNFVANLSNPGGRQSNFSATVNNVPVGRWQISTTGFDTSGQRDRDIRNFSQSGNFSLPTISFTGGDGAVQPAGSRFQISGTASAEAGIDFIGIRLRNNADGSGTGENGQLTSEARIFMIPGTSGAAGENWTYTSPPLPQGTYEVTLLAQDDIGGVFYNGGTITAQ